MQPLEHSEALLGKLSITNAKILNSKPFDILKTPHVVVSIILELEVITNMVCVVASRAIAATTLGATATTATHLVRMLTFDVIIQDEIWVHLPNILVPVFRDFGVTTFIKKSILMAPLILQVCRIVSSSQVILYFDIIESK